MRLRPRPATTGAGPLAWHFTAPHMPHVRLLALLSLLLLASPASAQTAPADPVPDSGLNAEADRGVGSILTTQAAAPTDAATAESAEILPTIRLTPRDVRVPGGIWRGRLPLTGEWNYQPVVPDSFDGTAASLGDDTTPLPIPGHPMIHGFERLTKETGHAVGWTRTFAVPDAWKDQDVRVRLRFESLDGKNRVYVNGQLVGESERVNLPSEFDITDALDKSDENEVTIAQEWSLGTHWSKRNLGTIARDVYLQALPPTNIARLLVDTDLSDDLESATILAHVRIANDSDEPVAAPALRFTLMGPGEERVPLALDDRDIPLTPIAAGQMLEMTVPLPASGFETWDAEHPNLYHLKAELLIDGDIAMEATQRFGFREVTTNGDGELLVNGSPVKFRGTNYHMSLPGVGYFMSAEQVRLDLERFLDANMNVLRSRPTPMIEYVEMCDELGMYTTIEGMFTLMMYDPGPQGDRGADPSIAPAVREHMAAMLESYRSHPSVLIYGLANECPYYDYFKTAALGMKASGVREPLFFGSDDRLGVGIDFMDVNDDHYPRTGVASFEDTSKIEGVGWHYPENRPNMFTEWCHIPANNIKEYLFDPAIDDYWGWYAQVHADWTYAPENKHILGGFLFLGAPERKLGSTFPWRGFFDDYRRPFDMAWHVKKSHSPVRIADPNGDLLGDAIRLEVENRYDFRNLSEMTIEWRQRGASGRLEADVAPHASATLEVPFDSSAREPVMLTFTDPTGRVVDIYEVGRSHLNASKHISLYWPPEGAFEVDDADDLITIVLGSKTFSFTDGLLSSATIGDREVLAGEPELVVRPTQFLNFQGNQKLTLVNQAIGWAADEVRVERGDSSVSVIANGKYTHANGRFVTRIDSTGEVIVSYDFEWTGDLSFNCFAWGYALQVAAPLNTLAWERDAQWSHYPPDHIGRRAGEARASGDPQYDAAKSAYTGEGPKSWPWSQDTVDGVTHDFRSTKLNYLSGGLFDAQRNGVSLIGDGTSHLHAIPAAGDVDGQTFEAEFHPDRVEGRWFLQQLEFYQGSSEPHLTKSIKFDSLLVERGTRFNGVVTFRLAGNQ